MLIEDRLLEEVKSLPTLPTIFSKISEVIEDPRTSTDQLAKIISSDQASVFKILKVANSPLYGFRGKIDTISQAILYLGFEEIKNIIFALTIIGYFTKNKFSLNLSPVDLWAHSIGVGIITRTIGKEIGEKKLENFFLAGILHDIGKIIFLLFANKEYSDVLKYVEENNCRIYEAERQILGIDHSKLGKAIAAKWKLPAGIQDAIYYHHNGPEKRENDKLIASVHLANIIARAMNFGFSGETIIPEPAIKIWDLIKLPDDYFLSIKSQLEKDYENNIRIMLVD